MDFMFFYLLNICYWGAVFAFKQEWDENNNKRVRNKELIELDSKKTISTRRQSENTWNG